MGNTKIYSEPRKLGIKFCVKSDETMKVAVVLISRLKYQQYHNPKISQLQSFLTEARVKSYWEWNGVLNDQH